MAGQRHIASGGTADEMEGTVILRCIMGISGEHGREAAGMCQPGKGETVRKAGEAPGVSVAVEADVVVGRVETLRSTVREIRTVGGGGTGWAGLGRDGVDMDDIGCNKWCEIIGLHDRRNGVRGNGRGDRSVAEAIALGGDLCVNGHSVLAGAGLGMRFVAEVLEFHVEVGAAEDVAQPKEGCVGIVEVGGVDEVAHLAVAASGEADDAFGVGA